MDARLTTYRDAARRGAEYLLCQQNPDGSFVKPDLQADVYHKAVLALALSGYPVEASRLLNWIKANDLQPSGRLRRFDEGLALYKTSWICQGAHRSGRFDLSLPVMSYIRTCQAPCGGFFQNPELNEYVEPVCTAWAGVAAIYTGHLDVAEKTAACLAEMVAQQPDEQRFYFHMSPDGKLRTGEGAPYLDGTKPQQAYYCPGIAMLFFLKLHLATGEAKHLAVAQELFEFSFRCAEDAHTYVTAGKGAVAAGILYTITDDERAREACCAFYDTQARLQRADGWWCNPYDDGIITRLDHTAEFVVWYLEALAAIA